MDDVGEFGPVGKRPTLETALAYAGALGPVYRVDPICKKPLHGTGYTPTRDPAIITEWWSERPNAGIGLLITERTLIVVDIDRHGAVDGYETVRALALELPA